jgi:hypothetical protein
MQIPEYNFRDGDLVLVKFESYIHQPGISKYQSNEHHARTDYTKAITHKIGQIEQSPVHGSAKVYWVRLQRPFGKFEAGWVALDRLQPYVPKIF